MVGLIKNIIFGNGGAKITKRQTSSNNLVTSAASQNDPNHEREILRRKAQITHNSKTS
ncbi:MAG: hypothetical protein UR81_C0013G0007 [Candidatus Levybacteria bacterium GW2011_GWB1_35_5]|nr:MAG: hypothetical protein UR81_C0013G0007 [Candidatus Levybacteria bacterium GW2011_GWB1_35_5]